MTQKRSRLNIELVENELLSITCKPQRDTSWHSALEKIDHVKERNIVLIKKSDYGVFIEHPSIDTNRFKIERTPLAYRLFAQRLQQPQDNSISISSASSCLRLPPKIQEKAFTFQQDDIIKAITKFNGKCFLAHDMGCGKTMISLGVVSHYYTTESRHLIICPSYLRTNWWKEVNTWLNTTVQVIFKTKDVISETTKFIIISYDLAVRKLDTIKAIEWKTITCDESHYIKSRTAKRTKLLSPILQKCDHVLLLSGTPALSRPCELFTQLQALFPKTFKQYSMFAQRYCDLKKTVWGWDSSGSTNPDELSLLMQQSMIRRLKKDVLKDLPPKIRKQVSVPLSKLESKELSKHFKDLRAMNEILNKATVSTPENRDLAFQRQSLVSEMFRATARAKLKGVCEYVKGVLQDNSDQHIILFGFHQITMNSLEELIHNQIKEPFIRIDGNTPQLERQGLVDDFQAPNGPRIAILSIGACNAGITLTACHYTIFCELTWTPSLLLQCEDRTHRIGQEHVCHYDYLCAEDSLDERVLNKIQNKFGLLDQIIDEKQNADGFNISSTEEFERDIQSDSQGISIVSPLLKKKRPRLE